VTADRPGTLALVGGGEFLGESRLDAELVAASCGDEVLVVPTAAAYGHPERLVVEAGRWFEALGVRVEGLMVLSRADAEDPGAAAVLRQARCVYLVGESPLHFRSVFKSSPAWVALVDAWSAGAVVVASSGPAMAVTDPMVDGRGGGLTVGLGLVHGVAVVPLGGAEGSPALLHRTVTLAPPDVPVVGLPAGAAVVRAPDGSWRAAGAAGVSVHVDGEPTDDVAGALAGR
jgi:cyanophycinase